jgi:hypothetical protein
MLGEENISLFETTLMLIMGGATFGLDHHLNSIWHALNQMIPPVILKVIPNLDNHLLYCLQGCNVTTVRAT